MKLLKKANVIIEQAVGILDYTTTNHPSHWPTEPVTKAVHVLFPIADCDSPSVGSKTTYPKTPYPTLLPANDSSEPQFTSTPVLTDSQSLPMLITPYAIHFSESETTGSQNDGKTRDSPTGGKQPGAKQNELVGTY